MPAFTFCSFRLGASNAPGTFRRPEAGIALAGCTLRDGRVATRAEQYAIRLKGGQIRRRFTPAAGRPDNAPAILRHPRRGRGRARPWRFLRVRHSREEDTPMDRRSRWL